MTATLHQNRRGSRVEHVATLVRSVPVRLVEISRGGCRLECSKRLESGTNGLLAVELAGFLRVDDIRVARCQQRAGAGPLFQIGVELLSTRRLGDRTIRMAIGKIINGERDGNHALDRDQGPLSGEDRPREVSSKSEGRAPPGMSDRGS